MMLSYLSGVNLLVGCNDGAGEQHARNASPGMAERFLPKFPKPERRAKTQ